MIKVNLLSPEKKGVSKGKKEALSLEEEKRERVSLMCQL